LIDPTWAKARQFLKKLRRLEGFNGKRKRERMRLGWKKLKGDNLRMIPPHLRVP
jgi:hypothetical protein